MVNKSVGGSCIEASMRVFARQTPRHSLLLSAAGTMPAGAGRLQISGQGLPGKRKGGNPTPFACPPSSGDRAACWANCVGQAAALPL